MKRPLIITCLLAGLALFQVHAAVPILPFDGVQAGMRGTGRTVFHGTTIEEFQVEILGKLTHIGPDQNLILARCSGGPLAETGVMAGMSGSPVTVDGKLIGAIAYSWGFAKDAIAGITPIEEMLAIANPSRRSIADRGTSGRWQPVDATRLLPLASAPELEAFFSTRLDLLLASTGAVMPTAIPISVGGMRGPGLQRMMDDLGRAGFLPIQVGSSGGDSTPTPPLEPGSAMGIKLVRGAIEMAATGTVTWVDGDQILGFGHPLFGLGMVDLPLTGASVQALLPSLNQSAKMAIPLGEVGALRQDRASGVFGRTGVTPRMIPIRLQWTGPNRDGRTYSFDVADDPLLAPLLLYASLNGILAGRERAFGGATLVLEPGSIIKMLDGDDVALDNTFAGSSAFVYSTGIPAYVLQLLMNNTWRQPQIAGVNLILTYDDSPRIARIRRATLDRYRASAGDTVTATIVLRPYRGSDRVLSREILIPPDTPPGPLTFYVGSAQTVSRAEETGEALLPQDLDQLIRLINRLRRNDRIYLLASREDSGFLLGGVRLPGLPPSVTRILSRPQSRGNYSTLPRRGVLEETIDTDYAIEGGARLILEVEPS